MAKSASVKLDFAFFEYLRAFYVQNKAKIRKNFRERTKLFLDYNDREKNASAYLRTPQFEALEMYIFLKEYLKNKPLHLVFEDWYLKQGKFEDRGAAGVEQLELFGELDAKQYRKIFSDMKKYARPYSNYIFALTMGVGKTILMGTCIFYEFILADKFPDNPLYCHNALVFAPDKTVLQALRELEEFDKRKVIPPEYASMIESNLKFHFLDDAGTILNTTNKSDFNIIVSNTQKIILKKQHKEKSAQDKLWAEDKIKTIKASEIKARINDAYDQVDDLYDDTDTPEDEGELATNQRFNKLCYLEQLGIYVDEAHHAFGNQLAADMGRKMTKTSLRMTIDTLAVELKKAGTHVVSCFNYTGTPYIGNEVLPEVVYAYGLKQAIDNRYLKTVKLHSYSNTRQGEFVRAAINDFWKRNGENRVEGMLPKIAFFAPTIEELKDNLRPEVEKMLVDLGIPIDRILVNVGDDKLTSNDDIRDFNRLDSRTSEKQFILLVNKGREGWNCRSLFAVAMYRSPRSKIFVLQATMRCLREIGEAQEQADVYLSDENFQILEDELQQNFRLSAEELQHKETDRIKYEVRPVPPPVSLKLKRVRRLHDLKEKIPANGLLMGIDEWNTESYRLFHTEREGLSFEDAAISQDGKSEDITHIREKRTYSALTLTAEIARYLNRSPLEIESVLRSTQEGMDEILKAVNDFNELLYDEVIPRLFREFYDLIPKEEIEETEIELVTSQKDGYFSISANPDLVARIDQPFFKNYADKSFHLDTYCFDSKPERKFFEKMLQCDIRKIYFTGMLTHGQSEFYIHYIDPETFAVRSYYPDFLIEKMDGSFEIVEIKGDNKLDDPVVEAKKRFAKQAAWDNGMRYIVIPSSEISGKTSINNTAQPKLL